MDGYVHGDLGANETSTNVSNFTSVISNGTGSVVASAGGWMYSGPRVFYWLLYFCTYSVPAFVFRLLSTSISVTLNFTTLLLIFGTFFAITSWYYRYRYLNKYSRLPLEPQRREPQVDLLPENEDSESRSGFGNYLDEFLSAIKVFGYLERPVFHELTRHMQTKKIVAGDTLLLEEEKGFCLVVDGCVQVFVKSANEKDDDSSEASQDPDQDQNQGYQLLTEVKNGAPMSSLFTILSLFTEDIKLRYDDDNLESSTGDLTSPTEYADPLSQLNGKPGPEGIFSNSSIGTFPEPLPLPHLSMLDEPESRRHEKRNSNSVHPNIVARAKVDTTIAIIPAEAFRRLTRIYPKSTSHIVQVILTRFQRVTFSTGHTYLGLTSEILRTERLINDYTAFELPNYLRNNSLDVLKEKFAKARENMPPERDGESIILARQQKFRTRSPSMQSSMARRVIAKQVSPNPMHAGDLLSYAPVERPKSHESPGIDGSLSPTLPQHTDVEDEKDDDITLREAVLECMFKSIGLVNNSPAHRSGQNSVEQSPRLVSYDSARQKAFFSNAFGSMPPIDDEESVISSSSIHSVQNELDNEIEIVFFPKNAVLVEQGERNPGLYYVIDGFLDVSIPSDEDKSITSEVGLRPSLTRVNSSAKSLYNGEKRKSLFMIKPGGIAGYLGSISGFRSFFDIRAKTDVYVGFLPRGALERILEKQPVVLLTMAKRMTSLLPQLILHLDFALEWIHVNAGQILYRQGEDSDAIYIVLSGRLRLITETDSKLHVNGEYGQGESVGELEVLTEWTRPGTLHAIRDTELVKFPKTLFNSLALQHPGVTMQVSRIIASRMRALVEKPMDRNFAISGSQSVNLRTVGILPVTAGSPVVEFSKHLSTSLMQIGISVSVLTQSSILNHLGRHAFNRMGKLKLAEFFADLEEKYDMVLYVADSSVNTTWTQSCVTQADCVLLVGVAEGDTAIGEYERYVVGTKTTARKELVLLHRERYCPPGLTRQWLKNRIWVHGHHHLQMPLTSSQRPAHTPQKRFTNLKNRVQTLQSEISKMTTRRLGRSGPIYSPSHRHKNDFTRLARRLCGKSIGLVLGGGGSRGIAQIGFIRAMEEEGIPIDMVGGTSIGAFNGGLYARDADLVPLYGRAKKFAGRMASLWRMVIDLTYPTTSYVTGHDFNRGIWKTFGESQIEDFWLYFYTNTSNISESKIEIHTSGYAWRYVRASMTLAGLLPPMCDEGHMLVDGGYMDNLTVSHMKSLGADVIFAVDVGSVDDNAPMTYGDTLSGFWVVLNRWNPFSKHPNVPTLAEIQARLAYVGSVDALEKAKSTPGCFYARPPVDAYGTLDFGKFDEIYDVGYTFGKDYLAKLRAEGKLARIVGQGENKESRRGGVVRRNSV